jgi:Nucleotidyltransferase of unknown function (DUF6036)
MAISAFGAERADELLGALSEQLAAAGQQFDLVVIGGSALLALGLIERTTRDVDPAFSHGSRLALTAPR